MVQSWRVWKDSPCSGARKFSHFQKIYCLGNLFQTCSCISGLKSFCYLIYLTLTKITSGLPLWLRQYRIHLQCRRLEFNPWVGKTHWRRKWQPTPVFLPGESHGQRSLVGYSPWGHKESDTTECLTHTGAHLFQYPGIHDRRSIPGFLSCSDEQIPLCLDFFHSLTAKQILLLPHGSSTSPVMSSGKLMKQFLASVPSTLVSLSFLH